MQTSKVLSPAKVVGPALGVKAATVLAWYRRGWIPGYRAGLRPVLFNLEEVKAVLATRSAQSQGVGQ